jgi:cobalt-zinc-cadmium efflux system outer membrane protein
MFFRASIPGGRRAGFAPAPPRPRFGAALGALLLGIAGCAVRDYQPPLLPTFMRDDPPAAIGRPVPEEAPTPAAREVAVWVHESPPKAHETHPPVTETPPVLKTKFADAGEELPKPKVDAPAGVTLDQAINACLLADPKLRAGWEAVTQAQADLLTGSLLPNPTFLGDALLLPFRRNTPEMPVGPPQTDLQLGMPIDWFLFGKRAAAMESARLGVDVSAADYADQVRLRIAAVVAAFFDVLEARALLDLARQDYHNLQRVESITAERVRLGGVGTVELDRVRLSVFDARREVRNREVTLAAARAKLRAFLGPYGGDASLDAAGSLDVPRPAAAPTSEEALALAEEARPDIISLKRQIARAEAATQSERAKAYPTVTPTLALTRQFQKSLGVPDASSWNASVTLSVPLFDRNQGNIAKARSTELQTALTLQSQLLDLRAEVEQAVETFRAAYANVTTLDPEQLKAARDVRDKIEAGYKAGGRTLLELLDAEKTYRDANRTYIMGRSTYWHSLHKLNAAVGKQVLR